MNRGSSLSGALETGTDQSFNEAPIHESGKCDADGRPIKRMVALQ